MNHDNPLTNLSYKLLKASLAGFGNTLNTQHCMALHALLDTMTRMAEGSVTGRWAFGLPTGLGKTRAIIEWSTAVSQLKLPYTLAVSASRIEALCTLKREMMDNGIPEEMIGLLHDDAKASMKATGDNDNRPFMLVTHQRIRSKKENLDLYNFHKGQQRNLLIYDESLMVSDVEHFDYADLTGCLAHAIYKHKHDTSKAEIRNYLVECLQILEYTYEHYEEAKHDLHLITPPSVDPRISEQYAREWERDGTISYFLRAANLDLRMLRSGHTAVVSYRVVVPEELKNMIILDASYPIRKLCLYDSTIKSAEILPSVRRSGVKPFHELKKFDHVQLYRLRAFGGRHSMEKRFRDRSMAKEVVQVLKTIPEDESVLFYVYKMNQPGSTDYRQILTSEIEKAGFKLTTQTPQGHQRYTIETWGNETSLNRHAHCSHVFLVGILHRDETELMGLYLGQTQDITGDIDKALAQDLQLSEKAHLAYQALSRGTCRTVSGGQARPMKGYLVEIDPEIETVLSSVMPGVQWDRWKPYFVPESDGLVETYIQKVLLFLKDLHEVKGIDRVSSQSLKKLMKADTVAPMTWTRVMRGVSESSQARPEFKHQGSKEKNHMSYGVCLPWSLEGRSLVLQTPERLGFTEEVA